MLLPYSSATDAERNFVEQVKASFIGRPLMRDDHGPLPGGGTWDAWRKGSKIDVLFRYSGADQRMFSVPLA